MLESLKQELNERARLRRTTEYRNPYDDYWGGVADGYERSADEVETLINTLTET